MPRRLGVCPPWRCGVEGVSWPSVPRRGLRRGRAGTPDAARLRTMRIHTARLPVGRNPFGLLVAAAVAVSVAGGLLSIPAPAVAQEGETPAGEWRYIGGDAGHTRYSGLDQITADNFEDLELAWLWRGRQLRADHARRVALDADLRRRRALHRRRPAPPRRRHRPGHRRDALDPPRAPYHPLRPRDAPGLRQGRGLRRDRRPRRHLHHQPRLLPARARRQDRPAPGELGQPGAAARLFADRRGRPAARPHRRLGPVAELGRGLRPGLRHPARAGLHHQLVAARSSSTAWWWSATRPSRATTRRASRTSRATSWATTPAPASTSGSSTSSRAPASSGTRRGRTTPGSGPATSRRGRRCRPTRSGAWSTCPPIRRPSTSTAGSGRATGCSGPASSHSTSRPASGCGTSRPCTTTSGTSTTRPRRWRST